MKFESALYMLRAGKRMRRPTWRPNGFLTLKPEGGRVTAEDMLATDWEEFTEQKKPLNFAVGKTYKDDVGNLWICTHVNVDRDAYLARMGACFACYFTTFGRSKTSLCSSTIVAEMKAPGG